MMNQKDKEREEQLEPQDREVREPEEAEFAEHIRELERQAAELQKTFPDFDLRKALQDPVFVLLTSPGTGISVEDAYYAMHRKEIQQSAARQTREKMVSAIQSGSRRPLEAGTSGQAASMTTFRYGDASKEQRENFKKELRKAWGRGETVYPR